MKKVILISVMLVLSFSLVACQETAEKWSENMQLAMEAFGEDLRALGELDADTTDADQAEVIDELDASWVEVQAVAEAEGIEITALEQAMDELEQALRSGGGEPVTAQKDFLNAYFDAMSEFFATLGS